MTRPQLTEMLVAFFKSTEGKLVTLKQVWRARRLDTHPLKMLAMDIMEEMELDGFIKREGEMSFCLAEGADKEPSRNYILTKPEDNNAVMHEIMEHYALPYEYPEAAERAANEISDKITEDEIARREDMRDVWTCTIDPHDAKDFDDALSLRLIENGQYEIGVHR